MPKVLHRYTPTLQHYDYNKVMRNTSTSRIKGTELYSIKADIYTTGEATYTCIIDISNKLTAEALAALAIGRTYKQLKNLRNKYTNKEVQLMALLER